MTKRGRRREPKRWPFSVSSPSWWGDCHLLDEQGYVTWPHWETLTLDGGATGGLWVRGEPGGGGQPPVRFDDDTSLDDDFGLTPRSPLAPAPSSEPEAEQPETGSGDETP
jgi:hypothetical protein